MGKDEVPIDTMATYTCNHGYTLSGDRTRTCRNDKTWNGSEPTCKGEKVCTTLILFKLFGPPETTCNDLSEVANGNVSYYNSGSSNRRLVNAVATYSCNSGYSLEGGENRTCEVDGDWSGTAPTCVGKCLLHTCMHLSFLS